MWRNDRYLKYIDYSKYRLISFDVFDTLLFRTFARPVDLFEAVAIAAGKSNAISDGIHPEAFRDIRIKSEAAARKKKNMLCGTKEITFYEIYDEIPDFIGNKKEILNIELAIEKKSVFLNPSIYSLMEYLSSLGKDMVLVSDMYLPQSFIVECLESCGFDFKLIKKFYLSNEYMKRKSDGELFDILLNDTLFPSSHILHIGDNFGADVTKPEEKGINAVHYAVSIPKTNYDIYERESLIYGKALLPEIKSLRQLAVSLCPYSGEDAFWFRLGAEIVGPILALGCGWTALTAEERSINHIYPLMREGYIFSEILKQIVNKDELDIEIKPLYVSRASVFMPCLFAVSGDYESFYSHIESFINTKGLKIENIFDMLETARMKDKYKDFLDLTIKEAEKKDIDIIHKILNDLTTEPIKKEITAAAKSRYLSFKHYLEQFQTERYLTLDVGYAGTIPSFLDKINSNGKHLLIFNSSKIIHNIINGTDISTYGRYQSTRGFDFVYHIFEQLLMCAEGTTLGYNEQAEPILSPKPLYKLEKINICHDGAKLFNELFLTLSREKRHEIIKTAGEHISAILRRLYKLPFYDECKYLGDLFYDNNFGASKVKKIIDNEIIEKIKNMGADEFVKAYLFDESVYWKEGAVSLIDQEYFLRDYVMNADNIGYEGNIIKIVKRIKKDNINSVIIYGAGDAGKKFNAILKLYDVEVLCLVDKNNLLHGTYIDGVFVMSLADAVKEFKNTPFVIASFAFTLEIYRSIRQLCGEAVVYLYDE